MIFCLICSLLFSAIGVWSTISDSIHLRDRPELRVKLEKCHCYWVGGRSNLYNKKTPLPSRFC